jgi:hypothetical protein
MNRPNLPPGANAPQIPTLSTGEAIALLRSATEVSRQRFAQTFDQVVDLLRSSLLERGRLDSGAPVVQRLLDGRRDAVRDAFLRELAQAQQHALERLIASPSDSGATLQIDMSSLRLVDADDDKSHTLAANAARRMRGIVENSSKEIELVLAQACRRESVARGDNPFGPEVVLPALLRAAISEDLPEDTWVYFLGAVERDFGEELGRVQQAVLDHFAHRGLDARSIRRALGLRRTMGVDAGQGKIGLVPRPAASESAHGGRGTSTEQSGAAAQGSVAEAGMVLRELLGRMQAHDGMPLVAAQAGPPPQPLMNAIAELQGLGRENVQGARISGGTEGSVNVWREHLLGQSNRTVDKLTIEIVGMMFDQILRDEHLPAEIKALLSRLQVPILKAALLDAAFFASPGHPARRLIDRIATTSAGWEPYGDENERFRGEVERIVQQVLQEFDRDAGLFDRILAEFDAFLSVISPRESDPIARAKRALEEAEKREVLVINTTIQVRKVFDRIDVEGYLKEFLLGPWVQVLVQANLRDDETSGYSKRFREVIHEIVWSIQPKATAAERQRLVELIPTMTRTVRDGVALIGVPQHEGEAFLKKLMGSHAMAVKPVDQATYIRSSLASSDVHSRVNRMQVTGTFPLSTVPGGVRITTAAMRKAAADHKVELTVPPMPAGETESTGGAIQAPDVDLTAWTRGSWFEIWDGARFVRTRLRWISPLRTMYMFSAALGQRPHVMSPDLIQTYLRRKLIRPLESVPLTERIAGAVIAEFQSKPQRAGELAGRVLPNAPDRPAARA